MQLEQLHATTLEKKKKIKGQKAQPVLGGKQIGVDWDWRGRCNSGVRLETQYHFDSDLGKDSPWPPLLRFTGLCLSLVSPDKGIVSWSLVPISCSRVVFITNPNPTILHILRLHTSMNTYGLRRLFVALAGHGLNDPHLVSS